MDARHTPRRLPRAPARLSRRVRLPPQPPRHPHGRLPDAARPRARTRTDHLPRDHQPSRLTLLGANPVRTKDLAVTDFLDEKRQEITDRLEELKPVVEEFKRLEAAAIAMAEAIGSAASDAGGAVVHRRRRGRPRHASRHSKAASTTTTAPTTVPATATAAAPKAPRK